MEHTLTQEKERAILDAARKRFAYYGFTKVTMDEIAADIGLAKASLYYYYPAKEDLFRAVVADQQNRFVEEMHTLLKRDVPAREKLRSYIVRRLEFFRQFVSLSSTPHNRFPGTKSLIKDLFEAFEQQELKLVQSILLAGKRSSEFTLPNPQQSAEFLLHLLHGLRLRAIYQMAEPQLDDKSYEALAKDMEYLSDLLLRSFCKQHSER